MICHRHVFTTTLLFAAFAALSLCVHAQEGLRPFNTIQPMTGMVGAPICVEPGARVEYRITMQDYDTYQSITQPSMLVKVLDEYVLPVPQTIHSMKPGYTLRFLGIDTKNIATWIVSGTAMDKPGVYPDV